MLKNQHQSAKYFLPLFTKNNSVFYEKFLTKRISLLDNVPAKCYNGLIPCKETEKIMVNILFDCPNLDDFYDDLKEYFSEDSRVAVVAFSFYDDYVTDAQSWERVYGDGVGNCYFETVDSLARFGVRPENVTHINYFKDTPESAREKILAANTVYFTGGLPDRMMDRICEFGLYDVLLDFDGVVVGYSAGAVIQLGEYHLSPDGDYPDFKYCRGLPYLDSFYLEVHYEHRASQDESIARVLKERGDPVYVLHTRQGGIVVENGRIRTVGKVDLRVPNNDI